MAYDPKTIEPKWQDHWETNGTFHSEADVSKPKFYALDMFPYPSGAGLHVGHPEGYTATDIVCRYKRMRGYNVMHPMGWDSYGLPAERYAMRTGVHPAVTTRQNIDAFRGQVKRLGFSYDWRRELATTDPAFVRWTQWIFLKLFERGLAYQAEIAVNWCPAQGTVLANEEVKDGRYVETGDPVERRMMRQWMLRITDYAERLLNDLDALDWPESIKAMQRNWIGRSEGADVTFGIAGSAETVTVFTTRPETLWGATYCVLAPDHPLVARITAEAQKEAVDAYISEVRGRSEMERSDMTKQKSGVFTGAFAVNPVNGAELPVWVADYVLMSYGTGAIMAVPAHDSRDHAFAAAFGLPAVQVVGDGTEHDTSGSALEGGGTMMNSPPVDGLSVSAARAAVIAILEAAGSGKARVTYRLRDWLFSRQRYWGEPIPVLHLADGRTVALPEESLPLLPPELADYKPTEDGEPPLARAGEWVRTVDPGSGMPALRETNTMPQWAGSCWYYLRFLDPTNEAALVSPEKESYWMPVDLYVGGAEHAVLHLMYARFWHKVLFDIGAVTGAEPFRKLANQGMILAYSYRNAAGRYYMPEQVSERDGRFYAGEEEVSRQIEKMSKSRYNVVDPDDVIAEYGADSLRLYEMFMGPLEMTKPWQTSGVSGVRRFLNRAWRLVTDDEDRPVSVQVSVQRTGPDDGLLRLTHRTVRLVTEDIEAMRFNTAVAKLMEMCNALTPLSVRPAATVETFILLLAPFAPHIAEELWSRTGHPATLAFEPWPSFDPALAGEEPREYVVQINGKGKHTVPVEPSLDAEGIIAAIRADVKVAAMLAGKTAVGEIHVPGKLVNFVVR